MKKLAIFNEDSDEDESSFQSKPLDEQKLSQFKSNTVRKSKREKEAEAAELKRREEEEHAAKAYADFLDAFDAPTASSKSGSGFVKSGGSTERSEYVPPTGPRASRRHEEPREEYPEPSATGSKPKTKRQMDSFLEELKRGQADREERHKSRNVHGSVSAMAAYETQDKKGSRDTGDPETTNIFVANLPPHVDESSLGKFFARLGDIGSVKIMWPRGDATSGVGADITSSRRSKSAGLSGFVQYMKRRDAEVCVREMDGFSWGGSVLRVGWSKAVPLAPKAIFLRQGSDSPPRESRRHRRHDSRSHSPRRSYSRSRSPRRDRDNHKRGRDRHHHSRRSPSSSRSRSPSRSRTPRPRSSGHGSSRPHGRSGSRHRHRSRSRSRSRSQSRRTPTRDLDSGTRDFIRGVAEDCQNHGKDYEENLVRREKDNRKYAFLWKSSAPGYDYFKSLRSGAFKAQGDFDDDGSASVWSTDSADESEKERTVRREVLGKLAKRKLQTLLRKQTGRREDIARAMVFCIDHAHAAPQVCDIIIASLLVETTAVPRKVARLHLICDILHNSAISVHKAWKFRSEFQARLPDVFDHLSTIYHSFPGKMTAEIFKKQILSVVAVWEDWNVFAPEFTKELRTRLEGAEAGMGEGGEGSESAEAVAEPAVQSEAPLPSTNKFKAAAFKPAAAAEEDDLDGAPVDDDLDGEPVAEEPIDVDGEPLDLDGEAMDGEDLDGDAMDGEDLDGDALDGQPLDGAPLGDKNHDADVVMSEASD